MPANTPGTRDETGRLLPGAKLNPNGRPKVATEFRLKARAVVDELVLEAWEAEVRGKGENWLRASELLAAYGYGKPTQAVEVSNPDQQPFRLNLDVLTSVELLEMARLEKGGIATDAQRTRMAELIRKATPPEMVGLVWGAIEIALAQAAGDADG